MTLMGKKDERSVAMKQTMKKLVCSMYQGKLKIQVNKARYKLLTKKKKLLPTYLCHVKKRLSIYILTYNASSGKKY